MESDLALPLSAVVVTKLKAGLIVGMDFLRENNVIIDIPNNCLNFPNGKIVHFNNAPGNPKVSLLRIEANNVILPGDTLTLPTPVNFLDDTHIAVEPRDIPWPDPCILENKAGNIDIKKYIGQIK